MYPSVSGSSLLVEMNLGKKESWWAQPWWWGGGEGLLSLESSKGGVNSCTDFNLTLFYYFSFLSFTSIS